MSMFVRTARIAMALAAGVSALTLSVEQAMSAAPQRAIVVAPGAAPRTPGASVVRPGAAIESAITGGKTGMFTVANSTLASDGTVQTIAVVENGRIVDLMSRRGGVILQRTSTNLTRNYSAQRYQQLLAYGLDRGLTGALKTQFLALSSGTSTTTPTQPATPPCPADYAAMKPIQKTIVKRDNPAYAGCPSPAVSKAPPSKYRFSLIPEAQAANFNLLYFEVGTRAFFSTWGIEYQADNYLAFNIGGIRAIFSIDG